MAEPDPVSCSCGITVQCSCNFPYRILRKKIYQEFKKKPFVDILLLGAAETGKSTIMRQMKIIHDGEMTSDSLRSYRNHVINNVKKCVHQLISAVSSSSLSWESEEAEHAAAALKEMNAISYNNTAGDESALVVAEPDQYSLVSAVWNDGAAQTCWSRANEFSLPDSTAYYLNAIDRILNPSFVPTQEDVLRLRLPTTQATSYDFTDKGWTFRITDVGGQRGERKRWIRLFHGIDAIIFLAALSEYDQFWHEDEEDGGINRLELSLSLFKETVSYPGFSNTTFVLFLNKVDVFEQKILTSNLEQYFHGYRGLRCDSHEASEYIRDRFLNAAEAFGNHSATCKRFVYPHETCATDTDKTKVVFTVVRDDIMWYMVNTVFNPFP